MIRPPAVAGTFYPGDPALLASTVDKFVAEAAPPPDEPLAAAYVVPHAGYRFSGATAAHVYARLALHADRISRVVLVGPAHFVPLKGCAVPTAQRWSTPLGEIDVDPSAATLGAAADDAPHAPEHSLEVQIPFLQRVVPHATVIPVAVGATPHDDVMAVISAALGPGTVVLCSTDLSHYLTEEEARRQDARTAQAILGLDPAAIGVRDACGVYALRGTLAWARHGELRAVQLALDTSARTSGDTSRVVGYPAFQFFSDL